MDDNNFAKQFVELLDSTGFPGRLPAKDALEQIDTVISALTVKVLGDLGKGRIKFKDLVAQGGGGGGGPHRVDLLVHYSMEAARSEAAMPGR
ncbi:MAG: hypothetical protein JWN43_1513 [Gammaproteobacteria bacterium]|nr:hypothetical protein [Gammaproteobacteria bacterium]